MKMRITGGEIMSLSIEEAVYEGVTAVLEAYKTEAPIDVTVGAAIEALEDFVVDVTGNRASLADVMK